MCDVTGWHSHIVSWHFQRQLWARYGIRLDHGEYSAMLRQVRTGTARRLPIREAHRGDRAWYAVQVQNRDVFVVASREALVTALPPDKFWQCDGEWKRANGRIKRLLQACAHG